MKNHAKFVVFSLFQQNYLIFFLFFSSHYVLLVFCYFKKKNISHLPLIKRSSIKVACQSKSFQVCCSLQLSDVNSLFNLSIIKMEGRYQAFYSQHYQPKNYYITDTINVDEIMEEFKLAGSFPYKQEKECILTTHYSTFITENQTEERQKEVGLSIQEERNVCDQSSQTQSSSKKIEKNENNETLNLSRYFHQQIWNYLKQMNNCKLLTPEEWQTLKKYETKSKCFETNAQLFKSSKIRKKCLQYFESSTFMNKLMSSSKMQFERKIRILKYIKKLCIIIKESHCSTTSSEQKPNIKRWLD